MNLETRLCLLKQSWINLEANAYPLKWPCLILLWHHQNSCIHTFTFSHFLMMTIIIKKILFDFIKTCMIYTWSCPWGPNSLQYCGHGCNGVYSAWFYPFTWNSSRNLRKSGLMISQKSLMNLKLSPSGPGLLSLPQLHTALLTSLAENRKPAQTHQPPKQSPQKPYNNNAITTSMNNNNIPSTTNNNAITTSVNSSHKPNRPKSIVQVRDRVNHR